MRKSCDVYKYSISCDVNSISCDVCAIPCDLGSIDCDVYII